MTEIEKRTKLVALLAPDTDTDEVLDAMLESAAALVLNKMYPFGYADDKVIPARYEMIQIQLAVELYNKRGAEGQTGHGENGITRSWPEKSRLLAMISPMVGSVIPNA